MRGTMSQQETSHQQQLSRARADRRVLHRNSRDFLEGKKTVEQCATPRLQPTSTVHEPRTTAHPRLEPTRTALSRR